MPEVLVRGVLDHLAERGWADVEEVTTAEETLTFSLPRELRPQRARAGRLTAPLAAAAAAASSTGRGPAASTSPVSTAIVGNALTSGAADHQQPLGDAGAGPWRAGQQHHHRHRDGHQQRRLHQRPEQAAAAHPGHREHAAAEVADGEHRAERADPEQVDAAPRAR